MVEDLPLIATSTTLTSPTITSRLSSSSASLALTLAEGVIFFPVQNQNLVNIGQHNEAWLYSCYLEIFFFNAMNQKTDKTMHSVAPKDYFSLGCQKIISFKGAKMSFLFRVPKDNFSLGCQNS